MCGRGGGTLKRCKEGQAEDCNLYDKLKSQSILVVQREVWRLLLVLVLVDQNSLLPIGNVHLLIHWHV